MKTQPMKNGKNGGIKERKKEIEERQDSPLMNTNRKYLQFWGNECNITP